MSLAAAPAGRRDDSCCSPTHGKGLPSVSLRKPDFSCSTIKSSFHLALSVGCSESAVVQRCLPALPRCARHFPVSPQPPTRSTNQTPTLPWRHRFIMHSKKTAFIVEHDFIMAAYLADR